MNKKNSVETELRSWKPRPASPNLEQKLFGRAPRSHSRLRWTLQLATPVAACLLFTTLALRQHSNHGDGLNLNSDAVFIVSSNRTVGSGWNIPASAIDSGSPRNRSDYLYRKFESETPKRLQMPRKRNEESPSAEQI
jgi:hypothetical protein